MHTFDSWAYYFVFGVLALITVVGYLNLGLIILNSLVSYTLQLTPSIRISCCPKGWRKMSAAERRSKVLVIGLALLSIVPFWLLEFVESKRVILDRGGVVQTFPQHTILNQWTWNALMNRPGAHLVNYELDRFASVSMTVHPITENPKVRSLRYVIVVRPDRSPTSLYRLEQKLGVSADYIVVNDPRLSQVVRSLLFEFNEEHSKELATLYNPLDERQQNRFGWMVRDYLDPKLAEYGVAVSESTFDMGD